MNRQVTHVEDPNDCTQHAETRKVVHRYSHQPYQRLCDDGLCAWCKEKAVAPGTQNCSKRCAWAMCGKCPQCGRDNNACNSNSRYLQVKPLYCSYACANQAMQANWCTECGVRQTAPNQSKCFLHAESSPSREGFCRKRSVASNMSMPPMTLLGPNDKDYRIVLQHLSGTCLGFGNTLAVVKLGPVGDHHRSYLAYRSSVEKALTQNKVVKKYCHGGEGNELRRYSPSQYMCSFGLDTFEPCAMQSACVCGVALCGPRRHPFGGHLLTSSVDFAVSQCQPNALGVVAVLVCRVVVGAACVENSHDVRLALPSSVPSIPPSSHSSIQVHTAKATHVEDVVTVLEDAAVEPMFLVLATP